MAKNKKNKKNQIRLDNPSFLQLRLENSKYIDQVLYEVKNSTKLCFRTTVNDNNWLLHDDDMIVPSNRNGVTSMVFIDIRDNMYSISKVKNSKKMFFMNTYEPDQDENDGTSIGMNRSALFKMIKYIYHTNNRPYINDYIIELNDKHSSTKMLNEKDIRTVPNIIVDLTERFNETVLIPVDEVVWKSGQGKRCQK